MLNAVNIVGRLTKDPELRYTPTGIAVANFVLAVNRTYKNSNGEYEADFINCVVWKRQAENLANYTKKGYLVGISGKLQTRSYETTEGKRQYITEVVGDYVVFLDRGASSQSGSNNGFGDSQGSSYSGNGSSTNNFERSFSGGNNNRSPLEFTDDDLPF